MGKQYNTELQAKVETYMKETGISQAKLAPMMNLSGAVLSQYRRSVYDKGDVEDVERKIREFFQIKEEQAENARRPSLSMQYGICGNLYFGEHLQDDPLLPA